MRLMSIAAILPAILLYIPSVQAEKFDYRLLATSKTSTMEKEMNRAGSAGFQFGGVMGGESSVGGKEVIVVMTKKPDAPAVARQFKLLATSRTGTMEKELQQAGAEGFEYCGQTVFESAFGGREVAVILERSADTQAIRIEYKLLATNRTSTMEKELQREGEAGFKFLGVVVGKTALGGKEVISILQRSEK
jgi:hypothetical protein